MKKVLMILIIIIIALITGFLIFFNAAGDVSKVKRIPMESQLYSQSEIDVAMDVAINYFKRNFEDCSLLEIGYIGDEKNLGYQEFADRNNADDVIVFISSFSVGSSGGDGSLNPNDTYKGWNWILVKNENGKWEHVDHGY